MEDYGKKTKQPKNVQEEIISQTSEAERRVDL